MKNVKVLMGLIVFLSLGTLQVQADDEGLELNTENCVASKWTDANGNPISIEEKFGPGSMAATHCLANTKKVKILYQINAECKNAACTAPYAIGNIQNHINDMVITHGMSTDDYEIVVVVHAGGWKLILDDATKNKFHTSVTKFMTKNPGVKFMFCQNTAAKKGVKLADMIPGVGFTTAGVSAISDLQESGYRYVQP